ncbi:MAG: hypothetical protein OWT27_04610 [Firmicutes bacterium]|nr:hypothetical protein [Bacillota bacterium]
MLRYDLIAVDTCSEQTVSDALYHCASELSLVVSQTSTLATYPGSTHWHLRAKAPTGVVEVTHCPRSGRIWVACHENRRASWTAPATLALARLLAAELGTTVSEHR